MRGHRSPAKWPPPLELRRLVRRVQQKELQGLLERDPSELTCRHLREHDVPALDRPLEDRPRMPCAVTALPMGPDGRRQPYSPVRANPFEGCRLWKCGRPKQPIPADSWRSLWKKLSQSLVEGLRCPQARGSFRVENLDQCDGSIPRPIIRLSESQGPQGTSCTARFRGTYARARTVQTPVQTLTMRITRLQGCSNPVCAFGGKPLLARGFLVRAPSGKRPSPYSTFALK